MRFGTLIKRCLPTALAMGLDPGAAWAAGAPGESGPSVAIFVAQLLVLMLVGRLLGEGMLRIGQPAVMGQLIAGLVLGPSVFGLIAPDWQHFLFSPAKDQKAMLDAIAQFGILVLLLLTGMETDLRLARQSGRASAIASLTGIIIPFLLGIGLGEMLPDSLLPDPDKRLITSLFLGTALSIASVKIVATIVREMNFMRRSVGQVLLASAIIDDTVGWMITAVIFSLALHGSVEPFGLARSIIGTIVFMGVSLTVGRRAVFFVIRWVNDNFESEHAVITAILLIMIGMAIVTDLIGVHTVLGAFVAGILVGESPILTKHIDEQLRGLIAAFFMPVFFGTAGLSADLTILANPTMLALTAGLILIASIGKFGGAFTGAAMAGMNWREALALGTGMNARGSTEVIVATVGLSMGALTGDLFTMIVTMAVITTMAMPPTLRWALARLPMRKEEKARLEREELEAKGFLPSVERLLVAVDDSANGKFASRIAGIVAGSRAMPTTVMHIAPRSRGQNGKEKAEEKAKEVGETVQAAAKRAEDVKEETEKAAAPIDVRTKVEDKVKPETVAAEAEKGYGLMLVGLERTVARGNEFHADVAKLAAGFDGPIAIADARDGLLEEPLRTRLSVLVPVNGTEVSRRAAEVAVAVARTNRASLTALYVAPRGAKKRSRQAEEAILKDVSALAESYGLQIKTAIRADVAPDEAIVKEVARRRNNLVVLGVGKRPGDKLFFGDTAAALLEKSDKSLLFVAS
jgi:Kef-type K+ transport system membrane component KefB/nucleotide-binding universal stress UspA family protein